MQLTLNWNTFSKKENFRIETQVRMAEWSMAPDSSSGPLTKACVQTLLLKKNNLIYPKIKNFRIESLMFTYPVNYVAYISVSHFAFFMSCDLSVTLPRHFVLNDYSVSQDNL